MRFLLTVTMGITSVLVLVGILEVSTALAQSPTDVTGVISQPKLEDSHIPTDLERSLRIQATVQFTEPALVIMLDCGLCPDEIDINGDGTTDALWNAGGSGQVQGGGGSFSGQGLWATSSANIRFTFQKIERTLHDENDAPVGVVFSGQTTVTAGEGNEEFYRSGDAFS